MDKEREDVLASLTKLRQGALLLTLANSYLCEPPLLRKIAREMYRSLQLLPEEIKTLKSQFPGKSENEAQISQIIRELHQGVKQLGNAEAETTAKCSQGDLGRELELRVGSLTAAVNAIGAEEEVKPVAHSPVQVSALRAVRSPSALLGVLRRIMTFFIPFVVIAALVFSYLFWTMDREQEVRAQIEGITAQATSSRTILKEIERQRDQLSRRLASLREKEMQKTERIASIELGQELHGVRERQTKVELDIEKYEEELVRLNAKLRKMEGKSFLARLLRL
jgi:hypothetical protein